MTGEPIRSSAFADAWIQVDRAEDPAFFVGVLDATRASLLARARRSPADFFAGLGLQPGHRVLDVGCGTGDLLRLLAPLVAPGRAVGIDLSETMIAEARSRPGSLANLSFQPADATALPFGDASFDRILAAQVLVHVPDPGLALREITRVLASPGLLSVTEIDWETVSIESTDRQLARRFTALACDGLRNGSIARQLPPMLHQLGYRPVDIWPETQVSTQPDAFDDWFVGPALSHFVRSGGFTAEEAGWFLHDLRERARQGRYFCARTTYTIIAAR